MSVSERLEARHEIPQQQASFEGEDRVGETLRSEGVLSTHCYEDTAPTPGGR